MNMVPPVLFILLFLILLPDYSTATTTYDHPGDEKYTNIVTGDGAYNVSEPKPDVYLNVPNLSVDLINLTVSDLEAHVSLKAAVSSLVTIQAGVDVRVEHVNLMIQGVKAKLLLEARLKNVYKILSRTLDTLDRNPDILTNLVKSIDGLVASTTNALGQVSQTLVDAMGNVVQKVVDKAGKVVSQNVVGNVQSLPLVGSRSNEFGQVVQTRQFSSGTLVDIVLDDAGNILSTQTQGQG